ncbi:FMN-dependent NADH-azoreductase [Bacillus sp. 1NLA3E]|uniref:FMN-dependent NADH-azoreductase n=1 Tax=Bacillus sp. 1NLA3E TaxID=666686 RepID=UPI000247F268|nr:NAD(P)H-dependent oxidoreductase [Bacillus sp. 1NLA3E]AGK55525.1 NAD(P)H dehydrogenase (quinone) [Bacillus sp. 1NLA3E]
MAKLLYITVNPKKDIERSKGRQIGEVFLETFRQEQPDVEIVNWDLFTLDMPQMDEDLLYARAKLSFMGYKLEDLTERERSQITRMHALADEFITFDYFVFVTPIWNLGSPAILKAFLDNLFVAGKTFTYAADGAQGLLTDKKALHIQTRGGIYSTGRMEPLEFGDRFLRSALEFLGMNVMETVYAEGLDHFPKQIPEIMANAKEKAAEAARKMAKETVNQ